MNVLIVFAHPRPHSLNGELARCLKEQLGKNHQVTINDLYAENFDPVLKENELLDVNSFNDNIRSYCDALVAADCLIVIHPNWWGAPPAMMKGWIDRVIRLNVGYGFNDKGEGQPVRLLKLKFFFVFNTSNTPQEREVTVFHDPLEYIWKYCIADFLGAPYFERHMFSVVVTSTEQQRMEWISQCCQKVLKQLNG